MKRKITIRKGRPDEIGIVLDIQRQAWHEGFAAAFDYLWCTETLDRTVSEIRTYLRKEMPDYPNPSFFLAFCDGEPAGALTCGRHRARFWIWGVFVRKKFRGLGIGEKLVDAALRGRNDVYIDVNLQNPAIKFWRKMGFRPLAESVVMARKGK